MFPERILQTNRIFVINKEQKNKIGHCTCKYDVVQENFIMDKLV